MAMETASSEHLLHLTLGLLPGLGPVHIADLLETLQFEHLSLIGLLKLTPTKRRKCLHLSPEIHNALDRAPAHRENIKALEQNLERRGISWMARGDAMYPVRLTRFLGKSAPHILFYQGDVDILRKAYFIGIIGTRQPSKEGLEAAQQLSMECARRGVIIVSGGARGIDAAAHSSALATGATVFVLPFGLYHLRQLSSLAEKLKSGNHLFLSEFHPEERGTHNTPVQRNRTVAALADAILVIETGTRGGTLHTVRFARGFGKPVLAVDFSPAPNPPGNASLLACVAEAVPAEIHGDTHDRIMKSIRRGSALLTEKPPLQGSLF